MPYEIKPYKTGYRVCKQDTNECYSKKPLPLGRAKRQQKAIGISEAKRGGFDWGDLALGVASDLGKQLFNQGKEIVKSGKLEELLKQRQQGGFDWNEWADSITKDDIKPFVPDQFQPIFDIYDQITKPIIEKEETPEEKFVKHMQNQDNVHPWLKVPDRSFFNDIQDIMNGGATPTDPKLYEKAKAIVNKRYKKPSAYRSGAYVKQYKDMGGTYEDDGEEKTLRRWFKEEWKDVGDKCYPVYRPTKRISSDTPLTPDEIDPANLREQIATKQKIRGKKNLPPFKAKGGATPKEVQEAGSAKTNPEVKDTLETPMGNEDISKYFPDARYIKYSELGKYKNITDLLPSNGSFVFLLYENKPNVGHWVLLTRYDDKIEYFDSYGLAPSKPLSWNRPDTNARLGQSYKYLDNLLNYSKLPVIINKTQFQSKDNDSSTCGAWDVLRQLSIEKDGSSLAKFTDQIDKYKKKYGLSGDEIVSNLISKR